VRKAEKTVARKSRDIEGQGSLFGSIDARGSQRGAAPARVAPTKAAPAKAAPARGTGREAGAPPQRRWRMPALEGKTVAEIRLRWPKRLTPAQVARVEAELAALPKALAKLGFGPVAVERAFVRRRRS
jgi:hypothetical protein